MLLLKAPAKINWFIYVLGKRADGYHSIFSAMSKITLYDSVELSLADSVELICKDNIPTELNIAYKAAQLLKQTTGTSLGAKIVLKKEIPMGAGLGGGSADGAYTLIGLNNLWNTNLSKEELYRISAHLGSDVPFFLKSSFSLIEGRGEFVTPLLGKTSYSLVLIKPEFSISTALAYSKIKTYTDLDRIAGGRQLFIEKFLKAIDERDFDMLAILMKNDISDAISSEYPQIGYLQDILKANGALLAMLTGSGSAIFGVFENDDSAANAYDTLKHKFSNLWLKKANTIIG
ncbi:MAG: 4-(cytidine 5'-diphospho)-2-C-methyl-D-erythritol kinase [Candidatus Magnetoovum sp. WYHC-5]|nr:4-(cytidine 5'-diphospho)-2-C-methyl-D-erythritol kinase [Candidatus Magnetoovum sp. WYHC-5]